MRGLWGGGWGSSIPEQLNRKRGGGRCLVALCTNVQRVSAPPPLPQGPTPGVLHSYIQTTETKHGASCSGGGGGVFMPDPFWNVHALNRTLEIWRQIDLVTLDSCSFPNQTQICESES